MTLELPGSATRSAIRSEAIASYQMPIGAWSSNGLPTLTTEGQLNQQVWKIQAANLTTLQILETLRQQLADEGYRTLFECATEACGGFNFRYETEVVAEPDMHVDLGDFRFLSAERTTDGTPEYISLLISRSANTGFVQEMQIGQRAPDAPEFTISSKSNPALEPDLAMPLAESLENKGFYILEDLKFSVGSAQLDREEFDTLISLATYLEAHPDRKVALVGHTDSEGSLNSNVALSKKRANAVVRRLIEDYGVNRGQLRAEGMGFLSPRASNLTDDGRMKNRRVEVILTSME